MIQGARIFWTGLVLHFKNLSASPFMMALGAAYLLVGFLLLRIFEEQGRRHGTLDRA